MQERLSGAIEPGLLTFPQLLKLKREQMKLSLNEAVKRSQITQLAKFEKGHAKPMKKSMLKLIAFYRLTEDEISGCRQPEHIPKLTVVDKSNRVGEILSLLKLVIADVDKIDDKGLLAKKLKLDALDKLENALDLIEDASIIERLI